MLVAGSLLVTVAYSCSSLHCFHGSAVSSYEFLFFL
jgi:hypothetical protein